MRTLITIISITITTYFFVACNPQSESTKLLTEAQRLVESNPDSAMQLIDSIFYPEKSLNNDNYMRYLVTRTQAKYKTYRPIEEDSLIFKARDYFSTRDKETHMAALAWFYSGCLYRERDDIEDAIQHYKEAEAYAAKTTDFALQGLIQYNIGDLFVQQGLYNKALENYKAAAQLYKEHPEKESYSLGAVGRMYLLDKKPDSAFYYFQRGMNIAESTNDNILQGLLKQNIGVAYQENGQYAEAEKYFRQSHQHQSDQKEQSRYYLNLAKLYYQMGQQDSAVLYTEKLKNSVELSKNKSIKISAYNYLAEWETSNGNNTEALNFQNKLINSLKHTMEDQKNQTVFEIEQKYNFEQQQNLYNRRFIRFQQRLILVIGILLVVAIAFLFVFRKMIKERTAKIKMQNNVLTLHATNKDLLKAEKDNLSKETLLKESLQWKLDILKKMVQLKYTMNEKDQKRHQMLFDKLTKILFNNNSKTPWKEIIQVVEDIYPETLHFINQQQIQLSETEYNVCLLSNAGLSVREIAFLLNLSEHTIYKARTNLNKKVGPSYHSVLL